MNIKKIADLNKNTVDSEEVLTTTEQEKAQVLAEFFSSVFTREPDTEIPTLPIKIFRQSLTSLDITEERVKKKLQKIKDRQVPRS